MATPTTVLIVRPEHLVPVKNRFTDAAMVEVVSESELLNVQDAILSRPPEVLVMQPAFAATSRGATLVSAIKSRPHEQGTALRVLIEDEVAAPLLLSQSELADAEVILETSRPLERAGTRQTARYPMHRREVTINGEPAHLIDLSVSGAQIQVGMRLRPMKVVRLSITDQKTTARLQGTVAWASAVPARGVIQYRAGVEFVNPDRRWLSAFCAKHGGAPDTTLGAAT